MTTTPTPMTGAELQTLREACNLTREEFAELANVQPRTVKHWEHRRAGVPADVADLVRKLDATIDAATGHTIEVLQQAAINAGRTPDALALLRYRTNAELKTNYSSTREPGPAGDMPASLHAAIAGRVRLDLRYRRPEWAALPVRVVWFDGAAYAEWLTVDNQTDSEAARMAWAAVQVPAQAIPHRG